MAPSERTSSDTQQDRTDTNTIVELDTIHSEDRQSKTAFEDYEKSRQEQPKNTVLANIHRGVVMFGILLAMFMISLNTTVIAPAMSTIATDLHDLSSETWIATAYLLAFNSSQPLSGKVTKVHYFNNDVSWFLTFGIIPSFLIFLAGTYIRSG